MADHIVNRFEFEIIAAGVLRIIKESSLLAKLHKHIEPDFFYMNDHSPEVEALRVVIKITKDMFSRGDSDKISLNSIEGEIPLQFKDMSKGMATLSIYKNWKNKPSIFEKINDNGCFDIFLRYLKVTKISKVAKPFADRYQAGAIDAASELMQEAILEMSDIGGQINQSYDPDTVLGAIREAGNPSLVQRSLYIGCPGIDNTVGGFETQTLNLLMSVTNGGKCLAKGTPVIMFDGTIKKVEDVVVGDVLMGDDLKQRSVLSLAQGREEMFTVTQKEGDSYTVNKSHILTLWNEKTKQNEDIELIAYLALSKSEQSHYLGVKVSDITGNKPQRLITTTIQVESVGEGDYYGFVIDGNRRFLLGDFTITHNTMMCHHLIRRCVEMKIPAYVSCVEDRYKSFMYKNMASLTGISIKRLKDPASLTSAEWEDIKKYSDLMKKYIKVDFVYGQSVDTVHKLALDYDLECEIKGIPKPVVNIVDYTGHIAARSQGEKSFEKMRNAFAARKDFALKHEKICFDFAQVNREGNKKMQEDKLLTQSDLAGAYDLAQVCDNIISINRDSADITEHKCRLHICKSRDGGAGYTVRVNTEFYKARYLMEEWSWDGAQPQDYEDKSSAKK